VLHIESCNNVDAGFQEFLNQHPMKGMAIAATKVVYKNYIGTLGSD
jgi:hypothetical protein